MATQVSKMAGPVSQRSHEAEYARRALKFLYEVEKKTDFAMRIELDVLGGYIDASEKTNAELLRACLVCVLDDRIREWLAANDPKALEQLTAAATNAGANVTPDPERTPIPSAAVASKGGAV
jgi:hypothetical protein